MWFAKWFGWRNGSEDTDEPARFAPAETRRPEPSTATIVAKKQAASAKGFDPYNSGAFEKRNAWERVSKR